MAITTLIENLESRRLLSATFSAAVAPADAPQAIVISPDHRVKAPASLDGIAVYYTVTAFHDADTFIGAHYVSTHTRKHFTTSGINFTYSEHGTYKYSTHRNVGTLVDTVDGAKDTVTLTFTSKHAGTFLVNYGGGITVSGTFTD